MVRDLSVQGRKSGSDDGASEFSIISTATGHLATGYTMAAVALATAWSPSDVERRRLERQVDRWSDMERSVRWSDGGRGEGSRCKPSGSHLNRCS